MKIKSFLKRKQAGSSNLDILFVIVVLGSACILIGAVLYHGGKIDSTIEGHKDAVARGYGHYEVNRDTLMAEFYWNVNTNK